MSLLAVDNLTVSYAGSAEPVVNALGFTLDRGQSLGIVGESGSGKSQSALALMGLLPANAKIHGSVLFDGTEFIGAPASVLNQFRARRIAMVFQDPMAALNPYVQIGKQLRRVLLEHRLCKEGEATERTIEMLRKVGLPDPERQYRAYPHQLSGGMRQRAMIGAALLGKPDLLIADEPTTALDVTVQAQILHLLKSLRAESDAALLLITHDLGVVAGNCERMFVMDRGRMLEEGPTRDVFASPASEKMRALLDAAPSIRAKGASGPLTTGGDSVLAIRELSVSFKAWRGRLRAVQPISLALGKGETMAVVGESGSGKTSLARAVVGLLPADSGEISLLGKTVSGTIDARPYDRRRELQMVFQDPLASLNPAMRVASIVAEPLRVHERRSDSHVAAVESMLARVGLSPELKDRYPHELSGGQAQRVAIARALILNPRVIICDEAVAALDGTVQNGILDLLLAEQQRLGLAIIFITHDLAVVRKISHRILVMYMGRLCELSPSDILFERPRHPYTKALLNAVPQADPTATPPDAPLGGEVSSVLNPPGGCPFHPRCLHAIALCSKTVPDPIDYDGVLVACHRAAELDLAY